MLYDTKAIREEDWLINSEKYLAEGWEYRTPYGGVIYLRKNIDGVLNTVSEGWENKIC